MNTKARILAATVVMSVMLVQCLAQKVWHPEWLNRSTELCDSVWKHYREGGSLLLRENFNPAGNFKADYLAESQSARTHAFLWPYSGALSAEAAKYEVFPSRKSLKAIKRLVAQGLDLYLDTVRKPAGYASYTRYNPAPDRFYDDNVWIGIDFTDLYIASKDREFLKRAEMVWNFVVSGRDSIMGDGIYWCEQRKESKNPCSNAPAAVFALKLYTATLNKKYLAAGKELYEWTRKNLYDCEERVYSDNIRLDGKIGRAKFSYNSGQMLQAASLLYQLTLNNRYKLEADTLAKACAERFFTQNENGELRVRMHDVWFDAVMLRGFLEYSKLRPGGGYMEVYRNTLEELWEKSRNSAGPIDFSRTSGKDRAFWLLGECGAAEMMARLAGARW